MNHARFSSDMQKVWILPRQKFGFLEISAKMHDSRNTKFGKITEVFAKLDLSDTSFEAFPQSSCTKKSGNSLYSSC